MIYCLITLFMGWQSALEHKELSTKLQSVLMLTQKGYFEHNSLD